MKRIFKDKRIVAVILAVVVIGVAVFWGVSMFGGKDLPADSNLIAEGVNIAGTDVGGMTKEQAIDAVEETLAIKQDMTLTFRCEGQSFSVSAGEIALKPDAKKSVEKAYAIGRSNDKKKNKEDLAVAAKSGIRINPAFSVDTDKLLLIANDYLADKISDPAPMSVEIGEDCLIVTNAAAGMVVNKTKAKKAIEKELEDLSADRPIELVIEEYTPDNLTFEEFCKEYLREAKDAVYTRDGDKHNIEPEVIGIEFDTDKAEKIFRSNKASEESYEIPAVITYPEITAKALEDKYVNKIIATYSTSFAGSSAGRCTNIELATSKINGYVLNPGERFSYNDVVGPRTAAAGFKMAHVYVGNEVVDGIGGGICQVSSTLYNAVVLADLKTVSRTNHSMPVSYVPMGRDATVSYGTIDYVFENDKSYPVSIKASISGTTLTISIVGTSEMDYTVDFVSGYSSAIAYGTVTVEDATIPEGEQKVLSQGSNGSVYDSYRVYKRNGVEFDRKYESKSRYQPTARKVAVGTMKAPEPEIPQVNEETPGTDKPEDNNGSAAGEQTLPSGEETSATGGEASEETNGAQQLPDVVPEHRTSEDVPVSSDTADNQTAQ